MTCAMPDSSANCFCYDALFPGRIPQGAAELPAYLFALMTSRKIQHETAIGLLFSYLAGLLLG